MNEIFLQSVANKMDSVDQKLVALTGEVQGLKETIRTLPDYQAIGKSINTGFEEMKSGLKNVSIPKEELRYFSAQLAVTTALMKQPPPQKVLHHHHFPKLLWGTVLLFIALTMVCAGWYMTGQKLDLYRAGDLKYRYLKLTLKEPMLDRLYQADSLSRTSFAMKDSVIKWEEEKEKNNALRNQVQANGKENQKLKAEMKRLEQRERNRRK